jgi:hypothetical protein
MFKPEFAGRDAGMGTGLGDAAGNQVAAFFESFAQRGCEKCAGLFLSRGANPPQGATFCQPELTSRIAKGQFQFSV